MEALNEKILNVPLLELRQKHPGLFLRFDQLAEGESLRSITRQQYFISKSIKA
jgi:hypothetical protein